MAVTTYPNKTGVLGSTGTSSNEAVAQAAAAGNRRYLVISSGDTSGATDPAAIQSAINAAAASGGMVVAEAGATFYLGSEITWPSNHIGDYQFATFKRVAGAVFDMVKNADQSGGNSGIRVSNLIIDGNKSADSLVSGTVGHRFAGISLVKVTDGWLSNVRVKATVNAEGTKAGIYLNQCSDFDLFNAVAHGNDKSGILLSASRVRVFGANVYSNTGSGITSDGADDSEYYDITAHDNGYSQISINGLRSKGNNLRAWNGASGYAGVNIGHDAAGNRSDGSVITNVHSYSNAGWGLTIVGSENVQLRGLFLDANTQENLKISDNSTRVSIDGMQCSNCGTTGAYITSGRGHKIANAEIFKNAYHGINVGSSVQVQVARSVCCYNNGLLSSAIGGILLNAAVDCVIEAECFDDQTPKTQGSGLWMSGGSGHLIMGWFHDNLTYQIRESSAPAYAIRNVRTGKDALSGSFSGVNGSASVTITNDNARTGMLVGIFPINAAGRTLGQPVVTAISDGVSFTVTLPGTSDGTQSYAYSIL